jgi:hypothetical protein
MATDDLIGMNSTLSDGTFMEAGGVATTQSGTLHAVPSNRRFNRIPVVMIAVSSANGMEPVISRVQAVTKSDLRVELHGGGFATHASDIATLAYIALEPSAGTLQGVTFEAHEPRTSRVGNGMLWHSSARSTPPRFYSLRSRGVAPAIT